MIGYLIIALVVLNMFLIFRRKNSKITAIISIVCLWLIMGLNTYTDDYPGYEYLYNTQGIGLTMEPGFTLITRVIYRLGLSYEQFLAIFMLMGLIVGTTACKRITNNYHVVIFVFSLTALYLNVDEIRQYMAYVLYALALGFLADERRGKLKYGITICVAATMQISSIALLPFPFVFGVLKNRRKVLSVYFSIIVAFCLIVFLNGNKIPFFIEIVSLFIPENKLGYFDTKTNFGFVLFFLANFLNMLVAYYAVREVKRYTQFYSDKERRFVSNLYDSILYLSFAMPLCMVNSEFLRFFRFSVIPCIFALAIIFNRPNKLRAQLNKQGVIMIGRPDVVLSLYVIVYQLCMQHWRIVEQVIENNMLN